MREVKKPLHKGKIDRTIFETQIDQIIYKLVGDGSITESVEKTIRGLIRIKREAMSEGKSCHN